MAQTTASSQGERRHEEGPALRILEDSQQPLTPPFELGRRPALDGLRGLAIFAVLSIHTSAYPGAPCLRGGVLGVDGFFVLSGFLITALLGQERQRAGSIHLGKFYLRRV